MKIAEQLHNSKFHREGFDPSCPKCVKDQGISGIIQHLESCAKQNEADAEIWNRPIDASGAGDVAKEQRRMIGVLKLYRKVLTGAD